MHGSTLEVLDEARLGAQKFFHVIFHFHDGLVASLSSWAARQHAKVLLRSYKH